MRRVQLLTLARFVREDRGQNIVEFALLLPLLMYILMGIIQFGFIFAAYLTLNNAVREAARWGTVYVYDNLQTVNQNDDARRTGMIDRLYASRGILAIPARGASNGNMNLNNNGSLAAASCPAQSGATVDTGNARHWWYGTNTTYPDVTICYAWPTTPTAVTPNDPRRGAYLDVEVWYHQQVFIPLLQQFLPDDPLKGSPWIRLPARITVIVN